MQVKPLISAIRNRPGLLALLGTAFAAPLMAWWLLNREFLGAPPRIGYRLERAVYPDDEPPPPVVNPVRVDCGLVSLPPRGFMDSVPSIPKDAMSEEGFTFVGRVDFQPDDPDLIAIVVLFTGAIDDRGTRGTIANKTGYAIRDKGNGAFGVELRSPSKLGTYQVELLVADPMAGKVLHEARVLGAITIHSRSEPSPAE